MSSGGFSNPFAVDLRALALMRLAAATILLVDLSTHALPLDLEATGSGAASFWPELARFSLYRVSDLGLWSSALLTLSFAAALMLLVGWRTRGAIVVSLGLLVSLISREASVPDSGDQLLVLLLIWSLLLPVDARWSVDAAMAERPLPDNRHASLASAGVLLQAMSVHVVLAIGLSTPAPVPDTVPSAGLGPHGLAAARPVMELLWVLPFAGSILIVSPVLQSWLRPLLVAGFMALDLALVADPIAGLVPFVALAMLPSFIPPPIWDRLEGALRRAPSAGLTIFYDGGCAFCERSSRLLRGFLALGEAQILPSSADPAADAILRREVTWVVREADGELTTRSTALATLLAYSPLFFWLSRPLRWQRPLADRLYQVIGRNRGRLGPVFVALFPRHPGLKHPGLFAQAAAAVLIGLLVVWHITGAPERTAIGFRGEIFEVASRASSTAGSGGPMRSGPPVPRCGLAHADVS